MQQHFNRFSICNNTLQVHWRLDMPENFDNIKVNARKCVEVEYLRTTKIA